MSLVTLSLRSQSDQFIVVELTPAFLREEDSQSVPPNFTPPVINQKGSSTKRIGNGRKRGRPLKGTTPLPPPIILEIPEGIRRSSKAYEECKQLGILARKQPMDVPA